MAYVNRRQFLALAAAGTGAVAAAAYMRRPGDLEIPEALTAISASPAQAVEEAVSRIASVARTAPPAEPPIMVTAANLPPVLPRGGETLTLMADTPFEASGYIFHSGQPGPRVMVLGGVHGNEPGGWMAAEAIAGWEVRRGVLIVLPRLNHRSAALFERTLPEYGDLNRMYPGDPSGDLPMSRMAHEITMLAREWQVHWLFDLHESWGFFNERGENSGTAFIGQTVTTGGGTASQYFMRGLVESVNGRIADREELVFRSRPGGVFGGGGRGTSSLSLGNHVPGLTPVLVEMGQQGQTERRRSELHQVIVREALTRLEMV
jgi:hypothetical protein